MQVAITEKISTNKIGKYMQRIVKLVALLALTGCASLSGEKSQPVTVQTRHENEVVEGIGCTLHNDAGTWFLTSPASVTIHKSAGELVVDCKSDRIVGNATVGSKVNSAYLSNFLILFGIGYIIDRLTGAGFDYPTSITVMLNPIDEIGNSATSTAPAFANISVALVPFATENNAKE